MVLKGLRLLRNKVYIYISPRELFFTRHRQLTAKLIGLITCCLLKRTFMLNPFFPQSPLFYLLSFHQKNILDTSYYSLPFIPLATHLPFILNLPNPIHFSLLSVPTFISQITLRLSTISFLSIPFR